MPNLYIDSNASPPDVQNDGTSWGDAYLCIKDALAGTGGFTAMAASDEVWFASNHSKIYYENTTLSFPTNVKFHSVNSGTDEYEPGAVEATTAGTYDLIITVPVGSKLHSNGVSFKSGDDFTFNGGNSSTYLSDCDFGLFGIGNDSVRILTDGIYIELNNVNYNMSGSGQSLAIGNGNILRMTGGTLGSANTKFLQPAGSGGCTVSLDNVNITMTSGYLSNMTSYTGDGVIFTLSRCKKSDSVSRVDSDTVSAPNQMMKSWSAGSGDEYYDSKFNLHEGKTEDNTTVKRTDGATYYDSTGFSIKVTPNSNINEFIQPLNFRLKVPQLDLSGGDVGLRVYILLDDSAEDPVSLTDKNCRIKAVYPDGTNTALGKTVYSNPTVNILTTATDLPTETVTFTGHSGTNQKQHYLDLTIPQNTATGMDEAVCELWLEVSKDLSTGTTEMFVCPEPTVS